MLSVARDLGGPSWAAAETAGVRLPGVAEITVRDDLPSIEAEWRTLEARSVGHVFQTYDFIAPWLEHVGRARGIAPHVAIGRDQGGTPLFILPFGTRRWGGARVLEWLGGEHADYHGGLFAPCFLASLATDRRDAAALPTTVMGLLKGVADVVCLSRQPGELGGVPNPFAGHQAIPHASSSHNTRLGDDWETYYRSKRNSSSRRHDRSKSNRLEKLGPIRLVDATTPEEIRPIMTALFEQKQKSLAALGVPDFFASPGVRAFYDSVAQKPYPAGPCHVAALMCGDSVVATNWGLVRGDRYYYVMHSYADGPAGRNSPGRQLMYHLMQWCIEREIDIFDFTIGDEGFKAHWCEESLPLYDSVFALNARGSGHAAVLRLGKAMKRGIKANPALRARVDQVRRWRTALMG